MSTARPFRLQRESLKCCRARSRIRARTSTLPFRDISARREKPLHGSVSDCARRRSMPCRSPSYTARAQKRWPFGRTASSPCCPIGNRSCRCRSLSCAAAQGSHRTAAASRRGLSRIDAASQRGLPRTDVHSRQTPAAIAHPLPCRVRHRTHSRVRSHMLQRDA